MPWNPGTLRTLRERKGLTQDQLADLAGVARISVARWETGGRVPTIDGVEKLAKALTVPVAALLKPTAKGKDTER